VVVAFVAARGRQNHPRAPLGGVALADRKR
jgi:hypothetical protein